MKKNIKTSIVSTIFLSISIFFISTIDAQAIIDGGTGIDGAYSCNSGTCNLVGGTYNYTTFNVNSGAIVNVTGSSPLIIKATDATTINGAIVLKGGGGTNGNGISQGGTGGIGIAGGGNGGNGGNAGSGGFSGVAGTSGSGGGVGGAYSGGGGYQGTGGTLLYSGSGGGGGSGSAPYHYGGGGGGGAGGGYFSLDVANSIVIGSSGSINADGGNGGTSGGTTGGAGAGGSGGAIVIRGYSIVNNGSITANGGVGASDTSGWNRIASVGQNGLAGVVSVTEVVSDIVIQNPNSTKISTAVSDGSITVDNGTITSTSQATTQVKVTYQTTSTEALFPTNTIITEANNGNFDFQNFTLQEQNVTNEQPTSRRAFRLGINGKNLNFSQNVTVTVNVGSIFNGQILDILYQQEGESTWNTHGTCTITNGNCTFQTDHATIYTINGEHKATGDTPLNLNVQVEETLSMDCFDPSDSNTTIVLGTTTNPGLITAGTPAVGQSRCTVTTNADQGYYLTVENSDPLHATLTHTDPNTGAIYEIQDTTPWNETTKTTSTWSAPTTKGLSFSVISFPETDTSHNQFDGVWNETGICPEGANPDTNNYAGIPVAPQTISAVTSYQASATTTDICYKVDVPASQPSGQYTGQVMFTTTSDASGYYQ